MMYKKSKNEGEAFRYFLPLRERVKRDACVDPLGRNEYAIEAAYLTWKSKRDGEQEKA